MSEATSQSQPPAKDLIGSYFLDLWCHTSKTLAVKPETKSASECEEEEEESPTELDTVHSSGGFSVVGPDKLSLLYPSVNLHGHDVGVAQANRPAPMKRLLYYFEIHVKNAGSKGQIAIGFTTSAFRLRRQPGWEANSYGYHGDDGMLYRGHGKGDTFGPTYTTGDTVGGGINYATQEFFFTKNGVVVGSVYKDVKGPVIPTVAVHSQNEEVTVNFGKDPFVFDLKAYEAEQRAKQQIKIDNITIPQDASYGIVRSYLQHYGYEETLKLFDIAGQSTVPPISLVLENGFSEEDSMYALNQRRTLRQLIKSGKIDETFSTLRKWYPQIVEDDTSTICFLLHCQKFIELVRDGKLEEAIMYGRSEFDKFRKLSGFDDLVKDCAALLAYEQPSKSSVGYLLQESQRELVADAVNAMILSTNPKLKDASLCMHSCLERLIRQVTACFLEKRSLNGDQGEAFQLSRILKSVDLLGYPASGYKIAVDRTQTETFDLQQSRILRQACSGMEGANGLSNLKSLAYTSRYVPLSPYPFLSTSTSYSDSSPVESKGNTKCLESVTNHQRCSSESFLIEEQPSWLDDLLNESETVIHRGHRRSASDSYAYLGEAAETFNISEEPKYVDANFGTSTRSQNLVHYKDVDSSNSTGTKTNSLAEKNNQELEEVVSTLSGDQSRDETSSEYLEGSSDKVSGSQAKSSGSKDSKRAKQHNAHRSRVRKLQYIAHLERTVQILKAEGSEVSAELEFIEQQNIILNMENRALRQRLESISQEQIIKNWEQGMLEREIGRLQTLYHLQKQQQMQLQHHQQPHNQHSKQRRNRSRDLDHQSNSSTKNKDKDASSSKSSVSGSVRV
ncbi:Ran-binding protein M [Sesamum alatum]|uniref:Ran-binding protein M n=1 Tax=Sesamum alatum TaxID=300844 RepID=A0AAE2C8Y6_9LAMI|nr:Ran-binding protein M [Sesamum alatum]